MFGARFVSYVCCLSFFCHVCVMCVLSDCVVGGCVCCLFFWLLCVMLMRVCVVCIVCVCVSCYCCVYMC